MATKKAGKTSTATSSKPSQPNGRKNPSKAKTTESRRQSQSTRDPEIQNKLIELIRVNYNVPVFDPEKEALKDIKYRFQKKAFEAKLTSEMNEYLISINNKINKHPSDEFKILTSELDIVSRTHFHVDSNAADQYHFFWLMGREYGTAIAPLPYLKNERPIDLAEPDNFGELFFGLKGMTYDETFGGLFAVGYANARIEDYLQKRILRIQPSQNHLKVVRQEKRKKSNDDYGVTTLKDLFIPSLYDEAMGRLAEAGWCDSRTHRWIRKEKGFKGKVARLIYHFYANGYLLLVTPPPAGMIRDVSYNTFNIKFHLNVAITANSTYSANRHDYIKVIPPLPKRSNLPLLTV